MHIISQRHFLHKLKPDKKIIKEVFLNLQRQDLRNLAMLG